MQRTFIVPRAISNIAATVTSRGITTKSFLLALESGQIVSLDRRCDRRCPPKS